MNKITTFMEIHVQEEGPSSLPFEWSLSSSIFEIIFIIHHWVFLFSLLGSCFSALYFYLQLAAIFLTLIILFQLLSGTLRALALYPATITLQFSTNKTTFPCDPTH